MSKILTEVKYSLISFTRNKSGMFWAFGFPVILLIILGFMYGQPGTLTLYYVDHDCSQASNAFIDALGSTGAVVLNDGSGMDLAGMLKEGKIYAYFEIPAGFQEGMRSTGSGIPLYYDKTQQPSMAVMTIVNEVAGGFNMKMAGASEAISVLPQDVTTSSMSMLDFALPGIIGMSIMSTAINITVSINAKNRARGIFRKLATTPISRFEWNASKIITQTIITLVSVAISVTAAWLIFGISPAIDATVIALVMLGAVTFVGLGLIFSTLIKNEESATSASGIVTFPLMFISGSFFPTDSMPWFFKAIADVSPLTYLNNGLRDAMIIGNGSGAMVNLLIVGAIGVVFFGVGVVAMKWKED